MIAGKWNKHYREYAAELGSLVKSDPDLLLAAFLADRAKDIRTQGNLASTPRGKAAAKRQARQLRTAFINRRFPVQGTRRRILQKPGALLFRPKADRLRDRLQPGFMKQCLPMRSRLKQRSAARIDLDCFSFAKNPARTMQKIADLIAVSAVHGDVKLNFVAECDDVTPYIVLAQATKSIPPVFSGGFIHHDVREVIDAVGIREALRIGSVNRKGRSARRGQGYSVSAFKMASRTPPGTFGDEDHQLRPQYKEFIADQFVDTINDWISEHNLELTEDAESSFVRAIGEALDNAERHGDVCDEDTEGFWAIAAFSRLMFVDGAPLLRCSVGIVSVGATIAESLGSASDAVQGAIGRYVRRHSTMVTTDQKKDTLKTVMALQDGITRVSEASDARRGGVGFMELVDVFAELGENGRENLPSVFTVISGRSCLRITHPHQRGVRRGTFRRELWFNPGNDPGVAPSEEHVQTLDHDFPGVILSACFTIDPDYLRKKLGDGLSDA